MAAGLNVRGLGFRVVHLPNNRVLGFWVIVIIVPVLGKYMIIRYLDPYVLVLSKYPTIRDLG